MAGRVVYVIQLINYVIKLKGPHVIGNANCPGRLLSVYICGANCDQIGTYLAKTNICSIYLYYGI